MCLLRVAVSQELFPPNHNATVSLTLAIRHQLLFVGRARDARFRRIVRSLAYDVETTSDQLLMFGTAADRLRFDRSRMREFHKAAWPMLAIRTKRTPAVYSRVDSIQLSFHSTFDAVSPHARSVSASCPVRSANTTRPEIGKKNGGVRAQTAAEERTWIDSAFLVLTIQTCPLPCWRRFRPDR